MCTKSLSVLEKNDAVHFSIKDDHPMRIEISFAKLGSTTLLYFLAPRIPLEEDEIDEELEDF